jgi:hypothetical protein
MCQVYLIKSLPLIKKATFSINGKPVPRQGLDFYELLDVINQNLDLDRSKAKSQS